jgi:hypothetical protein
MNTPRPPFVLKLLIAVSLIAMAALDFFTGQELVFSCAYLIPVALTAWWFSRKWTIGMAAISGITAFFVDLFDGYEYSHPGIAYWNGFTCFLISFLTGLILIRLKRTLTEREDANFRLQTALDELEASTIEVRNLQRDLQIVCAWTKRIKVGDEWMSPEEFLRSKLHLKLGHGISPEAAQEIHAKFPVPTASDFDVSNLPVRREYLSSPAMPN